MADDERNAEPVAGAGRLEAFWRTIGRDDHLPIDPDLAPDDPSEPSVLHRRATAPARRLDPRALLAIGIGGFLGTAARYGVDRAWPTPHGGFPMATFAVNTSGAFALGVLLILILERWSSSGHLRAFACVGVLGAWTTMSSLATEADVLVRVGAGAIALGYVAASLVAGLVAVAAGIALGRRREVAP